MSNVYAINKTGSLKTVSSWTVYYINSTNAELVTVYDSNNNPYDCFKYLLNNIEYYYVLDGVQNLWTNDLSSIGYHLNPIIDLGELIFVNDSTGQVTHSISNLTTLEWSNTRYYVIDSNEDIIFVVNLPTVTNIKSWFTTTQSSKTVQPGYNALYDDNGNEVLYDSTKTYIIDPTTGSIYVEGGTLQEYNGKLSYYCTNQFGISGSYWCRYYTCNTSDIIVVTVYDSSNIAYNAFKYTVNNTDYYYVLDGTQTGWTDDLSSIGYHIELPHDDVTGTVSSIILPTAHSGFYTGVSFDSLRYYAKGTLSNTGSIYRPAFGVTYTWYYGTITWEDRTLGDLSSKIGVSSPDGNTFVQQSVFRIIFISDSPITGYRPYDTSDVSVQTSQITSYTYNNGVHSITFFNTNDWASSVYAGRIQLRYLDGTTMFQNLSAFDLVNVSSGTLSKATTTNRYDMYNVWGGNITVKSTYSSTVVLPTVSANGYFLYGTIDIRSITIASSETHDLYEFGEGKKSFDTSKSYATDRWQQGSAYTRNNVTNLQIVNNSGYFAVKNVSSSSITNFIGVVIAICSDSTATVVPVYNSSNVAYNAFKFTAGGTDYYYYVLDGTQADWTDDLASIGYHYGYIDIILGLRYDPDNSNWKSVAFNQTPLSTENWWWACVLNQSDADTLQAFGLSYYDASSTWGRSYTGPIGNVVYNNGFTYECLSLYSDLGTTEAAQGLLQYITTDKREVNNHNLLVIWDKIVNDSTLLKSWKCRITRNS